MRLDDYLGTFSIDDLRELASRRGIRLSQNALRGRQTLVRTLASALGRYDGIYPALARLNRAELAVLQYIVHRAGKRPSLSGIVSATGADAAGVQAVLESLRLWGLLFPEGDWQHIVVPPPSMLAGNYLPPWPEAVLMEALAQLAPPPLEDGGAPACEGRPYSLEWDMAELLARVARARLKLTQAGRMNRRDLKAMEGAFKISLSGYSTFLYMLTGSLGLLASSPDGLLVVPEAADAWLAQTEVDRARTLMYGWCVLPGYPESSPGDPAEIDYIPQGQLVQRSLVVALLQELETTGPFSVASVARRLTWMAPMAFDQWNATKDSVSVAARLLRSLYWLGLTDVDDPAEPKHARLTPLAREVLGRDLAGGEPRVPEETQFFVQPNAEVFAPPNLAPRVLFHLRRITAETKDGPAGMYPLTAASLRRALDAGATVEQINTFLERFSRTGLPGNIRSLVETTGRQHGRIRIIPAGYILLTDEAQLLEELRNVKTVATLVGEPITERVALLNEAEVPELLRRLRARGYAPLNQAELGSGPELPADPSVAPALPTPEAESDEARYLSAAELDWSTVEEEGGEAASEPGAPVRTQAEIIRLLSEAMIDELAVEIHYLGSGPQSAGQRTIWPLDVSARAVYVYCCETGAEQRLLINRIEWAQLTGESFSGAYL